MHGENSPASRRELAGSDDGDTSMMTMRLPQQGQARV
jgi:hypothetical protein